MTYNQAIKVALELIDAECKRLAPLANMADPPPGLMKHETPGSIRAAKERARLREAKAVLSQRVMELEAT
jgi:hypothetical protein